MYSCIKFSFSNDIPGWGRLLLVPIILAGAERPCWTLYTDFYNDTCVKYCMIDTKTFTVLRLLEENERMNSFVTSTSSTEHLFFMWQNNCFSLFSSQLTLLTIKNQWRGAHFNVLPVIKHFNGYMGLDHLLPIMGSERAV